MKKLFTIGALLLLNGMTAFCQTATDFTANDCAGVSHHLFSELDAGKIIVVSFVMPCGNCISPSLSAQSTVQGYAATNPGKVVFYISDDQSNTDCATLSSWASTNSLGSVPAFSDPSFRESDYGTIAMPKIVVLSGTSHHINFTQDNTLNAANLQSAINTAIATTSVQQINRGGMNLSLFPNPAKDRISISYLLQQSSDVSADVYNLIGNKVISVSKEKQPSGRNSLTINFNSIPNGIYFVKLHAGGESESFRFVVEK